MQCGAIATTNGKVQVSFTQALGFCRPTLDPGRTLVQVVSTIEQANSGSYEDVEQVVSATNECSGEILVLDGAGELRV